MYWLSYLTGDEIFAGKALSILPSLSFPFREETLVTLNNTPEDWKTKYYAGLISGAGIIFIKQKNYFLPVERNLVMQIFMQQGQNCLKKIASRR